MALSQLDRDDMSTSMVSFLPDGEMSFACKYVLSALTPSCWEKPCRNRRYASDNWCCWDSVSASSTSWETYRFGPRIIRGKLVSMVFDLNGKVRCAIPLFAKERQ